MNAQTAAGIPGTAFTVNKYTQEPNTAEIPHAQEEGLGVQEALGLEKSQDKGDLGSISGWRRSPGKG